MSLSLYITYHTNIYTRNEFNYIIFICSIVFMLWPSIVMFVKWEIVYELIRLFVVGAAMQSYLIIYFLIKGPK